MAKGFINVSSGINTTSLTGTTNIVTPVNGTINIPIGIADYKSGDILEVYMDNVLLYPTENYTPNADGLSIDLVDNVADGTNKFMFHVIKGNMIQSSVDWTNITNKPSFYINPIDKPPINPSQWDDEFTGTSLDSKWSWINRGTSTVTIEDNVAKFWFPPSSSYNQRMLLQSAPSSSFTMIAKMSRINTINCNTGGLVLYNTNTGKFTDFTFHDESSFLIRIHNWNSLTTWNSNPISVNWGIGETYFKINYNGTNIKFWYSPDGRIWTSTPQYTQTLSDFLESITHIGICGNNWNSAENVLLVDWFRVTEP